MRQFRIRVMNRIAPEGLNLLDEGFAVSDTEADPHGILVRSAEVNTEVYPSLLAVSRAGAGVNNITVQQATEKGICIFNTPGANANAVAELVFIMIGISARHIHQGIEFCRSLASLKDEEIVRQIEANKAMFRGYELAGRTLGVLGLGKIGALVANRGLQHSMQVLGFDPFPAIENIHTLSPEVQFVRSLNEIVKQADILSLHMPYNKKTHGLVNRDFIARMKNNAILVNYARGPIVEEQALLEGLASGQLAGYITDFPTAAMIKHPKVLFTPHLGASTEESEEQCSTMAVRELKAYLEYGNVTRSVNFPTVESIPSDKVHTRLIMINRDVPGMIGFVSQTIGAMSINIASYLNESNGTVGYNIIDVESAVPEELLAHLRSNKDVIRVRTIPVAQTCPD